MITNEIRREIVNSKSRGEEVPQSIPEMEIDEDEDMEN